jgi:hypothetical protein
MNYVLDPIKRKDFSHQTEIDYHLDEAYSSLKELQVSLQEAALDLQKFSYHVRQIKILEETHA